MKHYPKIVQMVDHGYQEAAVYSLMKYKNLNLALKLFHYLHQVLYTA